MDTIEELLGLLKDQTEINAELMRGKDDSLVNSNIAKSPGGSTFGDKIPAKLTSSEIRRATEVSNIFIKNFFEAEKRLKPDKKEKTLTSKIAQKATIAKERQPTANGTSKTSSWIDTLLGALGLAGLLKKLSPKFFKGLFSKILKGLGNMLKGIGSLVSSLWKKITGSKFFKAVSSAIKGALRGIGRSFSKIVSSFKSFFSNIVKKLKGVWTSIKGSKAFKSVGRAFSSAIKSIGSFFTGLKNKLLSILTAAKEFAKNVIPSGAKEFIGKGANAAKSAGASIAEKAGGFWNSVKNVGAKAVSGIKSGASAVGNAVVETGTKAGKLAVQGAKAVGNFALGPAKSAVQDASKGVIKGAGGMFKLMGKLVKLPVVGPLIESAFTAYDIKSLKEKYERGEISLDDLQAQSGRRVVQGVTALGGSALGTFLGSAAGTIIPVGGNIVGGILGAIGGDMLGRFVGGLLNDYIMPPKYSKSIGAFVTGTQPPKNEMQDFIIKGDSVYPFSNKDEILGMKRGGAIDEFLGAKQENVGLNLLVKASDMANMYLAGIERNTREMIKALGGKASNVTVVNNSPQSSGGSERPSSTIGNNRMGYPSSPYALA